MGGKCSLFNASVSLFTSSSNTAFIRSSRASRAWLEMMLSCVDWNKKPLKEREVDLATDPPSVGHKEGITIALGSKVSITDRSNTTAERGERGEDIVGLESNRISPAIKLCETMLEWEAYSLKS